MTSPRPHRLIGAIATFVLAILTAPATAQFLNLDPPEPPPTATDGALAIVRADLQVRIQRYESLRDALPPDADEWERLPDEAQIQFNAFLLDWLANDSADRRAVRRRASAMALLAASPHLEAAYDALRASTAEPRDTAQLTRIAWAFHDLRCLTTEACRASALTLPDPIAPSITADPDPASAADDVLVAAIADALLRAKPTPFQPARPAEPPPAPRIADALTAIGCNTDATRTIVQLIETRADLATLPPDAIAWSNDRLDALAMIIDRTANARWSDDDLRAAAADTLNAAFAPSPPETDADTDPPNARRPPPRAIASLLEDARLAHRLLIALDALAPPGSSRERNALEQASRAVIQRWIDANTGERLHALARSLERFADRAADPLRDTLQRQIYPDDPAPPPITIRRITATLESLEADARLAAPELIETPSAITRPEIVSLFARHAQSTERLANLRDVARWRAILRAEQAVGRDALLLRNVIDRINLALRETASDEPIIADRAHDSIAAAALVASATDRLAPSTMRHLARLVGSTHTNADEWRRIIERERRAALSSLLRSLDDPTELRAAIDTAERLAAFADLADVLARLDPAADLARAAPPESSLASLIPRAFANEITLAIDALATAEHADSAPRFAALATIVQTTRHLADLRDADHVARAIIDALDHPPTAAPLDDPAHAHDVLRALADRPDPWSTPAPTRRAAAEASLWVAELAHALDAANDPDATDDPEQQTDPESILRIANHLTTLLEAWHTARIPFD